MNKPPKTTNGQYKFNLPRNLSLILLVLLVAMTLFEYLKDLLLGPIGLWTSHAITIAFSSLLATIVIFLILNKMEAQQQLLLEASRERKNIEERQQLFAHTLQSIAECVSITDMKDIILHVNRAFLETYGYTEQELVGKSIAVMRSDRNDPTIVERILPETINGGWKGEVWNRRKDGTDFKVFLSTSMVRNESGEPIALVGIATDLSKHEHAQAELQESERRFRNLLETVQLLAVMLDAKGNVTFCNRHLCEVTGWSEEEILGTNWFDRFIVETEREKMKELFSSSLASSGFPSHFENSIFTRDGRRRTIEWDNTMLRDVHGAIVGTASIGRDVTDVRALEERYRQSQKLGSVGRLAGGIAHDFNNLLTVIHGYSEMLLDRVDLADSMREGLNEIRKAGEKAASLTQQLLAFSQKQTLQLRVLDLNALVAETQQTFQHILGEDIELITNLDPALGKVRADLHQVQQVLMHLSTNARDAMPDGGKLIIRSANVEFQEREYVGEEEILPGGYIMLSVTDTGCGLSEQARLHLFEPFFTTKGAGKGTGLGLPTVYGIIKQSDGFVLLESEAGKGTTVKILLPKVLEAEIPEEIASPVRKTVKGTETILLAEDQSDLRNLTVGVLKNCGYLVLEASNGQEAIAISKEFSGPIHLLITDIVMPGMNGNDLARQLKKSRPETAVVYMSGYSQYGSLGTDKLEPEGFFIQKPFTINELTSRVREILDQLQPRARILVVDDEPPVRNLVCQILKMAGFAVLDAPDGKAATEIVRRQKVDLVVTDLIMPEQEGIETIRTLRQKYPKTKIIAMSGAFDGEFLGTAKMLGAHAILYKPFSAAEILRAVDEVLKS